MILKKVWYYIIGYLEVTVLGIAVEKFLNLALQENILIWDVKKYPRGLKVKIGVKDFAKVRKVVKNSGCRVKIVRKRGLPFYVKKLKERKLLTGGIIFTLVVLSYLSSYIWFIDITGNDRVNDEEIHEILAKHDLQQGVKRSAVDIHEIEDDIIATHDEILWAGINIRGTRAEVNINEKEEEPEQIEGPSNIIAKTDAYIVDTMVYSGYPAVEPGDAVRKDDVLIYGRVVPSGTELGELEEEELTEYPGTQARGIVKGRVHYKGYSEKGLTEVKKERTGDKFTRYGLYFNGETRYLDLKEIPYVEYDKKKTMRKLSLNYPPWEIALIREELYEISSQEIHLDRSEAKELAKKEAYDEAQDKIEDIKDQDIEIIGVDYRELDNQDEDVVQIKAVLSVEKNIGEEIEVE
ncbi:sporulation protein YqfD [Natranaerobius thermophilus]|uniref:Sporulation protein YqfD n=1 Tax=Natranaerobius thermophilus (strain ATCC BAA-1301 / DSM 18059 / JW/NM-WN-LF) TaxID=457570 RepID=B2A1M5_NATTJ|nr:sporulation protein YqfD [Natranaerobius thermophilus]ACB84780.1 sporulation protein YqfD [Natranaerobius thermophilus JW/NM-WN-LF]